MGFLAEAGNWTTGMCCKDLSNPVCIFAGNAKPLQETWQAWGLSLDGSTPSEAERLRWGHSCRPVSVQRRKKRHFSGLAASEASSSSVLHCSARGGCHPLGSQHRGRCMEPVLPMCGCWLPAGLPWICLWFGFAPLPILLARWG